MKNLFFCLSIVFLFYGCQSMRKNKLAPEGMVWIPPGEFIQGAVSSDPMAMSHEKPAHKVSISGFYMVTT